MKDLKLCECSRCGKWEMISWLVADDGDLLCRECMFELYQDEPKLERVN
jgi:hypothetical protein